MTSYFYEFQGAYSRGHDIYILVDWKTLHIRSCTEEKRRINKISIDILPGGGGEGGKS